MASGACCLSGAALSAALVSFLGQQAQKPSAHLKLEAPAAPGSKPTAPAASPDEAAAAPKGRPAQPDLLAMSLHRGFSAEEAKEFLTAQQARAQERAPAEVLAELQRGNARFWTGAAHRPEKSAFERRALIMTQFPSVAVLGCADSRVPVEIVFDCGLGDMFVVRVAGNCLDTTTSASLQYAVQHLKVKVLLVMGHEGCGALKAAMLPAGALEQEPPPLCNTLKMLKEGLDEERLKCATDARARDREAVVANVRNQVSSLMEDPTIASKVAKQELIVVGALYEISSGIVDFFLEVKEPASS